MMSANLRRHSPQPSLVTSILFMSSGRGGVQGSFQAVAQQLMLLGLAQYL